MLYTEKGEKIETTASLMRNLVRYSDEALEEILDYLLRWQEDIEFNESVILRTFEELKDETIEHWLAHTLYGYKSIEEAEEDGYVIVPLNNGNHLIIDTDIFDEFKTIYH